MALTSRKKRPLDRTVEHQRDTRLVVIATEGAATEPQYFRMNMFRGKRVQVRVLPPSKSQRSPEHGQSAPHAVLRRLTGFKREFDLDDKDELWLVIDVDNWQPQMLDSVMRDCEKKGYRAAVSNPCFELWLFLHRADIDTNRQHTANTLRADLRRQLGSFNKSRLRDEDFAKYVNDAIVRAKALDGPSQERWPSNLGTHVYRLVESILRGTI
jgi:RloB-like protein